MTIGHIPESSVSKSTNEQIREGLHISYSQISTYMLCSQKFKFQYVMGMQPAFISSALPFGSAIHHALAFLFSSIQTTDTVPTEQDLMEVFSNRWEHEQKKGKGFVRFKRNESWNGLMDLGVKLILTSYEWWGDKGFPTHDKVVCVEKALKATIGEMDFIGIIDLIIQDGDDHNLFHLIDHKTAARRYDENKIATDLQLTAYKWLLQENLYLPESSDITLNWDVILKQKNPTVERYTTVRYADHMKQFLGIITTILRAIEQGIFYPNPGWVCGECGFKMICNFMK